jgi:hypothetical protein
MSTLELIREAVREYGEDLCIPQVTISKGCQCSCGRGLTLPEDCPECDNAIFMGLESSWCKCEVACSLDRNDCFDQDRVVCK